MRLGGAMYVFALVWLVACGGPPEGQTAGDCTDDADNDGDGLFDCDDDGCAGADACDEADTDTDTDTDADTDTDSDSDTDTDTDADTDTDTDADTDTDPVPGERFDGETRLPAGSIALLGDRAGDYAGGSVAIGDVDGDGVGDAIVGAYDADASGTDRGRVYVQRGPISADVNLWEADVVLTGSDGSFAGGAVAAGDFDDDGDDELVVAAPDTQPYAAGGDMTGTVWIVGGGASGDLASAALAMLTPEGADGEFGSDVSVGDITGDGVDDAVVGSQWCSAYTSWGGCVYVFAGPITSTEASAADSRIYGEALSSGSYQLGASVEAGDIDGDGVDDIVAGAPKYVDASSTGAGGLVVLLGPVGATALVADEGHVIRAHDPNEYLGGWTGVLAIGDFDGDGKGDIAVGSPYRNDADPDVSYEGGAYVVSGDEALTLEDMFFATWSAGGDDWNQSVGTSVASMGDQDGDGADDLLVGGSGDHSFAGSGGAAWVFYGPLSGAHGMSDADALFGGTTDYGHVGSAVAAGDVTGDGRVDLLLGAELATGGASQSGAVFLVPSL